MAKKFLGHDIAHINLDEIVRLLPGRGGWKFWQNRNRGRYISALINSWSILSDAGIDTPLRIGHFLGQGLVETGYLNYVEEGLSYRADRIEALFGRHYRDHPDLIKAHARNPKGFANHVYGSRMGNDQPGDGYKFRGRGFIQLTGKNNYKLISDNSDLPLLEDPDLIRRDLKASVEAATVYWTINNCNALADANDASALSRLINRGNANSRLKAHHEEERIEWTKNALKLVRGAEPVAETEIATLNVGSRGKQVAQLQRDLKAMGYDFVGKADGIYGKNTKIAVMAAQLDLGLLPTGTADDPTVKAIDEFLSSSIFKPFNEEVVRHR